MRLYYQRFNRAVSLFIDALLTAYFIFEWGSGKAEAGACRDHLYGTNIGFTTKTWSKYKNPLLPCDHLTASRKPLSYSGGRVWFSSCQAGRGGPLTTWEIGKPIAQQITNTSYPAHRICWKYSTLLLSSGEYSNVPPIWPLLGDSNNITQIEMLRINWRETK